MRTINRTGLEKLTCVVTVKYVDMDTSGGVVVDQPIGVTEYGKGTEITLWHDIETGELMQRLLDKGENVEVVVDHPFKQPDGRLFGNVSIVI